MRTIHPPRPACFPPAYNPSVPPYFPHTYNPRPERMTRYPAYMARAPVRTHQSAPTLQSHRLRLILSMMFYGHYVRSRR